MSHQLAEARRRFEDADAKYREALDNVTKIKTRIADREQRQRAITQQRLEGEAAPDTANEFAALNGDIETLRNMLARADAEARALEPAEARNHLAIAERNADREKRQAEFDALMAVAAKLDIALCNAIAQLARIGKQLGHVQLSQSWKPSDDLRNAIHFNKAPPGGR